MLKLSLLSANIRNMDSNTKQVEVQEEGDLKKEKVDNVKNTQPNLT